MHAIRFRNPQLQSQFLADLAQAGLARLVSSDGFVECEDDLWGQVNSVAHRIRDRCFKWYFSWCDSPAHEQEFISHLQTNGLRFEVEERRDRLVFLLPKEDESKHFWGDAPPTIESCSFCGKKWTEIQRFVTSDTAAICDECIDSFYRDMRDPSDGAV
jgi:hypothetical protein